MQYVICIQHYGTGICILWDETDNVRLPPDEIAEFCIHGTVRYWTSLKVLTKKGPVS